MLIFFSLIQLLLCTFLLISYFLYLIIFILILLFTVFQNLENLQTLSHDVQWSILLIKVMLVLVSSQPVLWATSSQCPALFPAPCVPPTAEPARRAPVCVNVAAAFIERPAMPTLLPAQVSFVVCLFVYARLSGRCAGLGGVICHWLSLWEWSHWAKFIF